MPTRPPTFRPAHQPAPAERAKQYERERGSQRDRGYTREWEKARLTFLHEHPLCAECQREGRWTPATDVDHITPHRGDQVLFWDVSNWQPLCATCHARKTRLEGGRVVWRGRGGSKSLRVLGR